MLEELSSLFSLSLIAAAIRLATPLLLAALGGMLCERAGVINISLEGMMLVGALGGWLTTFVVGNPWLGVLVGMLCGAVLSLIFAYCAINLGTNQIVTGVAVNMLALGVTSMIFRVQVGLVEGRLIVQGVGIWKIPVLEKIPVIGEVFFIQSPFAYIAVVILLMTYYYLYRTQLGLSLRIAGENPKAGETLGINTAKMRYYAVILSGLLSGLAGTCLSLSHTRVFMDNMTAGRGFIAYIAIILGGWNPFGVLASSLFFGFTEALQLRIQVLGIGVPYQLALMLPYVSAILLIILWRTSNRQPVALASPVPRTRTLKETLFKI